VRFIQLESLERKKGGQKGERSEGLSFPVFLPQMTFSDSSYVYSMDTSLMGRSCYLTVVQLLSGIVDTRLQ
jgi:hypothetical protein